MARVVAFARALSARDPDPVYAGPDHLAARFLRPRARLLLALPWGGVAAVRHAAGPLYRYMVARTRHYDRLFAGAARDRIPQIVLLGAGYDSRALRFAALLERTRVWEVDVAATQDHKRRCLARAGLALPGHLNLVPADLARQSVDAVLLENGFNPNGDTLFIWEGVCQYLDRKAVDATLAGIRRAAPPGSRLAFDYIYRRALTDPANRRSRRLLKRLGEPNRFGIGEGRIESFLADRGFRLIEHWPPEAFRRAYLTPGRDGRPPVTHDYSCNVLAASRG